MKKGIATLSLALLSTLLVAFLADEGEQRSRRKEEKARENTERILDIYNIRFNKEVGETSIIFQLDPGDSIMVACPDCIRYLPNEENTKGTMTLSIRSIDGTYQYAENDFDEWIKIRSSNGKIGLVFQRDGFGEKILLVRSLRMWRKTKKSFRDVAGESQPVLDINNLYIDKLLKDATEVQTKFALTLKSEDQLSVKVVGVNGAAPGNMVCNQYKEDEEWDKSPIEFGAPFPVPSVDGGRDRFYFEFSHIEGIKGVNTYHIDIERIPARTTGYLDIVADSSDGDSALADTVEDKDPFLQYLELMQGDPDFTCTTPETKLAVSIDGRFKLGPMRRNKVCIPLELTDECVAAEECVGCDSIWGFWIGAGDNLINRYAYKDSIRQLKKQEGLIEGWARSRRYRGMSSSSIFPDTKYGEDIFFAIVDQADTTRFLTAPFNRTDWYGDFSYTISTGRYMRSYSYLMKYSPERPVSLCLCNNNAVTTVPVMFRFQQFLTEPKRPVSPIAPLTVN